MPEFQDSLDGASACAPITFHFFTFLSFTFHLIGGMRHRCHTESFNAAKVGISW